MNIFEKATKQALRFPSTRGGLTVEQLWTLPLVSSISGGDTLDSIAVIIHKELQLMGETSFVEEKPKPTKTKLNLMMKIIKHIIEEKQSEAREAREGLIRAAKKERLIKALSTEELSDMTKEELIKSLDEL